MKYWLAAFVLLFIMTCDEKIPGSEVAAIQDTTGVIIFKHAELVDVETGELQHDMDVLVDGAKITSIGNALEVSNAFEIE